MQFISNYFLHFIVTIEGTCSGQTMDLILQE